MPGSAEPSNSGAVASNRGSVRPAKSGTVISSSAGAAGTTRTGISGTTTSSIVGSVGTCGGAVHAGAFGMFSEPIDETKSGIVRSGMAGTGSSAGVFGTFDVIVPNDVGEMFGRFRLTLIDGSMLGGAGGLPALKSRLTLPSAETVSIADDCSSLAVSTAVRTRSSTSCSTWSTVLYASAKAPLAAIFRSSGSTRRCRQSHRGPQNRRRPRS